MIQVYTGNGKGKTTAALGLALRAAGAGFKVYICQFMKGRKYSELAALKKISGIKIEQFGRECLVKSPVAEKDVQLACRALRAARKAVGCGKYQLVVLDEINVALSMGLLRQKDVIGILDAVPASCELVLTGRGAPADILQRADLVSEIKEGRHYFRRGQAARLGIEY